MIEPKSFADFVPNRWVDDSDYVATRLYLFHSNYVNFELNIVLAMIDSIQSISIYPVIIYCSELEDSHEDLFPEIALCYVKGQPQITTNMTKRFLHPGGYCIILVPLKRNEPNTFNEHEVEQTMLAAKGFFSITLGGGIALGRGRIFDIDHATKREVQYSAVVEQPMEFGEFISPSIASLLELSDRAKTMDRQRIPNLSLSLSFFGRARNELDGALRFFLYWTGLEVYFGGAKRLSGYIDRARKEPFKRATLKRLKGDRDKMVHHGLRPALSGNDEKFIQSFLLLQICQEVGVKDESLESTLNHGVI